MNEVMTAKRLPADYRDAIATFADHFDHLFKKNILYETHKVFYCYFSITWKRTDNENEAEDIDNIEEVQSGGRCLTWAGVQTLLHEVPLQDGHGGGAESTVQPQRDTVSLEAGAGDCLEPHGEPDAQQPHHRKCGLRSWLLLLLPR